MQRAAIGTVKVKGFGPAAAPPGPAPHRAARPLPGGHWREGSQGGRGAAAAGRGAGGRRGSGLVLPPPPSPRCRRSASPSPLLLPFGEGATPRTGRKSPGNEAESASLCGQDPRALFFRFEGAAGARFGGAASGGGSLLSAEPAAGAPGPRPVGGEGLFRRRTRALPLPPPKTLHGRGAASRSDSYACRPPPSSRAPSFIGGGRGRAAN